MGAVSVSVLRRQTDILGAVIHSAPEGGVERKKIKTLFRSPRKKHLICDHVNMRVGTRNRGNTTTQHATKLEMKMSDTPPACMT